MGTLTTPYTFAAGGYAVASQVDANFEALFNWVNTNGIWADASTAFTGVPSGPNTDPTSANQLTRKSYVDTAVNNVAAKFPNSGSIRAGSAAITTSNLGGFTISWAAFPTATLAVLLTPADNHVDVIAYPISGQVTASYAGCGAILANSGSYVVSSTFNLHWMAIGY